VTHQSQAALKRSPLQATGIVLSQEPDVYLTALPGPWLLAHSTPSWRIDDPIKGFQRIAKEPRAKEIARTVLDTHRSFPNAITLATDVKHFKVTDGTISFPASAKFLVVDGQHRLWAQRHSDVSGTYPCVIHMDRTEQQMAALFLEINDTQKRVPSSLRWDLYRLVRPDDHSKLLTADIVYELATRKESPFYSVGIDLTGEKQEVTIKQGSLAPEIKKLVSTHLKKHGDDLDDYVALFIRFFVAIRSLDPEGWGNSEDSTFFQARILRALIRVLSDVLATTANMSTLTTEKLRTLLTRIDKATLSKEEVRRIQGSAGVQDLYKQMKHQVLGSTKA
jgi:DGQHR domain-containing protein